MEIGIYTFAERTPDPQNGVTISAEQRMQNLLDEMTLADEVGLDVFGLGEHHRPDFVISAPAVALAAGAARTQRIRLTSAVTVLSSDDPVRVFQEFATLDLISRGRAEIMAGRGSFIESFPLFGYDLHDYDTLFSEKLELLLRLRAEERVTWSGRHRAPLANLPVYPRPVQQPIPVWIAVGGTPQSVVRAGTLGLPLAIAIIGGTPDRFVPFADLYHETTERAGHGRLPVSINSHGWIADDAQTAAEEWYPRWLDAMTRIGRERGWPPPTRAQYDAQIGPRGALLVGSPEQIVAKILRANEIFGGLDRFLIQLSVGTMPHDRMQRAIELLGTVVAPEVRRRVAMR